MLFKPELIEKILKDEKTQTRRIVKQGEQAHYAKTHTVVNSGFARSIWDDTTIIEAVTDTKGRLKWKVGNTYAICPGRGKHGVGRIEIIEIRRERIQDINWNDVKAEGIAAFTFAQGCLSDNPPDPRWKFIELWSSINTAPGTRWEDNPEVWALTFRRIPDTSLTEAFQQLSEVLGPHFEGVDADEYVRELRAE